MTARKLRDAAARIREVAQAIPGSTTWTAFEEPDQRGNLTRGVSCSEDEALFEDRYCPVPATVHIALWSPPVAFAVADWLDALADELGYGFVHADTLKAATAVADLILGGAR